MFGFAVFGAVGWALPLNVEVPLDPGAGYLPVTVMLLNDDGSVLASVDHSTLLDNAGQATILKET
jgi:hypothetical protein